MESWRRVWREGIAPLLSSAGLVALEKALVTNDPSLLQGQTVSPLVTLPYYRDRVKAEAACALAYPSWKGEGLQTVKEVEERFGMLTYEVDAQMKEPAACRCFLYWFDAQEREELNRELLPEVQRELAHR